MYIFLYHVSYPMTIHPHNSHHQSIFIYHNHISYLYTIHPNILNHLHISINHIHFSFHLLIHPYIYYYYYYHYLVVSTSIYIYMQIIILTAYPNPISYISTSLSHYYLYTPRSPPMIISINTPPTNSQSNLYLYQSNLNPVLSHFIRFYLNLSNNISPCVLCTYSLLTQIYYPLSLYSLHLLLISHYNINYPLIILYLNTTK